MKTTASIFREMRTPVQSPGCSPEKKPRFPRVSSSRQLSCKSREVEDELSPMLDKTYRASRLISARLKNHGVKTPKFLELKEASHPNTFESLQNESLRFLNTDCLCGSTTPPEEKAKFREKAAFLLGATNVLSAKILMGPNGIFRICRQARTLPSYAGDTGVFLSELGYAAKISILVPAINFVSSILVFGDSIARATASSIFFFSFVSFLAGTLAVLQHNYGKKLVRDYASRLSEAEDNAHKFIGQVEGIHENLATAINKLDGPANP